MKIAIFLFQYKLASTFTMIKMHYYVLSCSGIKIIQS